MMAGWNEGARLEIKSTSVKLITQNRHKQSGSIAANSEQNMSQTLCIITVNTTVAVRPT